MPKGTHPCAKCGGPAWGINCRKCGWAKDRKPRKCQECGSSFLGSTAKTRFCSLECSGRATRPRQLRLTCDHCGVSFLRRASENAKNRGTFCTRDCAYASRRARSKQPNETKFPRSKVYFPTCANCMDVFSSRKSSARLCKPCRNRQKAASAKDRTMSLYALATQYVDGQYQGAQWRAGLLQLLVDRDGPNCGICRRKVDITLKSGTRGSKRGPSIDHIIPRSQGGSDDLNNLRLTHWGCNQRRGNRGGGEQLLLVG